MKAEFTFDEMVYNTVCAGRILYYEDVKKTIDYVKIDKGTRQVLIHCVIEEGQSEADIFVAKQDELHTFEVTANKVWKKPNKKRLRGKK